MENRLETARRLRGPIFSAIAWGVVACGSNATTTEEVDPFAAETFDETIETAEQAVTAGSGGSSGSAGASGSAGSSPAGAGGSAGSVGSGAGGFGTAGFGACGSGGRGVGGSAGSITDGGAGVAGFGGTFIPGDGGVGVGGSFPGDGGGFGGSAGTAGAFGRGGSAGTFDGGPGGSTGQPSAFWQFDDCSTVTRTLLDSSGNGIHALRTLNTTCAEGIQGQSMLFNQAGDRVEALNAPQFALDRRLAVAAWVNPERIDDNRPVVLKRLNNQTAFSLRVQNRQAQFSITLDDGRTVTTRVPLAANSWSHIAGLYDGRFVFLFLNGEQVGQIFAEGSIRDVNAPIRIGATTQQQRFVGRIDNVWISTNPVTPADIAGLSCIRQLSTLAVSPETSGPVPAGTTFPYDVALTNNDIGSCGPRAYVLQNFFTPSGFTTSTNPFFLELPSGQSGSFEFAVTSSEDVEPQVAQIPFFVTEFNFFEQLFGQVTYEVTEPTGCHVKTARELFMRNPNIVDDPIRTNPNGPPEDPRTGAWTFARLIENAAPSPEQAPDVVEQVVRTWQTDQTVNSFVLGTRPIDFILDAWPRLPNGKLDLSRSPLRLLAIVNRVDLRDLDAGHAGEGRFVFGVEFNGFPLEFTMILEYRLPASTEAEVLEWIAAWHALGSLPFPSEEYNAALQAITDRFTGRNAAPGRPNGSALLTLRSNEIALSSPWQLREFRFGADGFLHPSTIALTPDSSFNNTPRLGNFINLNESAILAERHVVPESFEGAPFLGGAVFNNIDIWFAPNVVNNEARHKFSLNTCNGCHGGETQTAFLHVSPRFPGNESFLSGFMTGIDVFDPFSGQPRRLNDLGRRNADLKALVCPPEASIQSQQARGVAPRTTLRKGIGRVH